VNYETYSTLNTIYACIDRKEEEIWLNHVSDGRLKSGQEILLVPEVKMMMF
jgi:hypothetical protein